MRLADEVGLWESAAPKDALSRVVGQSVSAVEVERNDVSELTDIRFVFADVVVGAHVVEADKRGSLVTSPVASAPQSWVVA